MENAYQAMFTVVLLVLSVLLFLGLLRAVKGPRTADRLVAVNMMTTLIIIMICVLAVMLQEGYLADVALIYASFGFLSVVLLTKVFMGVYLRKRGEEKKDA